MPILPKERDPRLTTIRRGGTLTDEHHRLLAGWALACAERVLPLFENQKPDDTWPRDALDIARAWIRGEVRAARASVPADRAARARTEEREWQRAQLPAAVRELVLDDQQRRERHLLARLRRLI